MPSRRTAPTAARPPGRPPKFGRPSRLVALTLPLDTIAALKQIDSDLARAIVAVTEKGSSAPGEPSPSPDVDLVQLTSRESLIVVSRQLVVPLAGVAVLPLDDRRAFLALRPGQGFGDLEVAVQDSLDEDRLDSRTRNALEEMKRQLREWRRDPELSFEVRSIIVGTRQPRRDKSGGAR